MRDLIPPAVARDPAEAVELVTVAISDGDLEAALAQYEPDAVLRLWQESPAAAADVDVAAGPGVASGLSAVMELRLPLALQVRAVVPASGLALVLGERRISGTGPDCQRIELSGSGATVVRRQPGGGWRIVADAWCLGGTGIPRDSPRAPGELP